MCRRDSILFHDSSWSYNWWMTTDWSSLLGTRFSLFSCYKVCCSFIIFIHSSHKIAHICLSEPSFFVLLCDLQIALQKHTHKKMLSGDSNQWTACRWHATSITKSSRKSITVAFSHVKYGTELMRNPAHSPCVVTGFLKCNLIFLIPEITGNSFLKLLL